MRRGRNIVRYVTGTSAARDSKRYYCNRWSGVKRVSVRRGNGTVFRQRLKDICAWTSWRRLPARTAGDPSACSYPHPRDLQSKTVIGSLCIQIVTRNHAYHRKPGPLFTAPPSSWTGTLGLFPSVRVSCTGNFIQPEVISPIVWANLIGSSGSAGFVGLHEN